MKNLIFSVLRTLVLLGASFAAFAQPVSYEPVLVPVQPLSAVNPQRKGLGIMPGFHERTNFLTLPSRTTDIRYGDKIRLRTVGQYSLQEPNPDGTTRTLPPAPQPFLGLMVAVQPGPFPPPGVGYRLITPPVATGLPPYVTADRVDAFGSFPTDTDNDFLIPPEGVTLCVPVGANFLVLLNPDPNRLGGIVGFDDFTVEVQPLEKVRLSLTNRLSTTNLAVGDTFSLTLSLTNYGNAAARGLHLYSDASLEAAGLVPLHYDSNLVERLTGPVPAEIASLEPGASAEIVYTFRAIGGGTNSFYARVGRTLCGGERYQQFALGAGPQVIAGEIVVNSTGDLPDLDPRDSSPDTGVRLADGKTPECTLRAALEFANRRPGRNTIKFKVAREGNDFDAGIPVIRPATPLPAVTNTLFLDGWTQDPGAATPPVEIDCQRLPGDSLGLHILASGTQVQGLVIQGFAGTGILVETNETTLQGNFIGTDPGGLAVRPSGRYGNPAGMFGGHTIGIHLRGSDNRVGGSTARERNVIAVVPPGERPRYPAISTEHVPFYGDLLKDDCAPLLDLHGPVGVEILGDRNRVEGNLLGVNVLGSEPLPPDPRSTARQEVGIRVGGRSADNLIGGRTPGAGNVISGNNLGLLIENPTTSGTVVQGNWVGTDATGSRPLLNLDRSTDGSAFSQVLGMGILVRQSHHNTIGGFEPGAGNVIANGAIGGDGIQILGHNAIGNRVASNSIGVRADGATLLGASGWLGGGVTVDCGASQAEIEGNTIAGAGIQGVGCAPGNGAPALDLVRSNHIFGCTYGVVVQAGADRVRISRNRIHDSGVLGIDLYSINSDGSLRSWDPAELILFRANRDQAAPRIFGVVPTGDSTRVQLDLSSRPFTHLSVEFFASDAAGRSGYGDGQRYLATVEADTGLLGGFFGEVTLPVAIPSDLWLTATASDPDGNTSEFSRAILVRDGPDGDLDGIVDSLEARVPGRLGSRGMLGSTAPAVAGRNTVGTTGVPTLTGDGNGDGIPDATQANVASLPGVAGCWLTFAVAPGLVLRDVVVSGVPDLSQPPAGYELPAGFVSLVVSKVAVGGVMGLTNLWFDPLEPNVVLAYGPTADRHEPHWFELPAEFSGRELRLTLTDGGAGDTDRVADGSIRLQFALARRLVPPPEPRLLALEPHRVTLVMFDEESGRQATNEVRWSGALLGWPASSTDWLLEATETPALPATWHIQRVEPVVTNGLNTVAVGSSAVARFYRLARWTIGSGP